MIGINTNLQALTALGRLDVNKVENAKISSKLSSGLRINTAADDAAGLAISTKMNAQVRELERAEQNVLEGVDLIRTADGGMSEISELLQRQQELVLQALNDINSISDRLKIQIEIDHLTAEIDAIANFTEYNGIKLLSIPYEEKEVTDDTIYNKLNVSVGNAPVNNNGSFTGFSAVNNEGSSTDILYESAQHTLVKIEVPTDDPDVSETVIVNIKGTNVSNTSNATCNGTTYNSSSQTWTTTWNYTSDSPVIDITFTQQVGIVEVYDDKGNVIGERYNIETSTTNNSDTEIKATTLISYDIDIAGAGNNPDFKIDGDSSNVNKNTVYTDVPDELEILHDKMPELKLSTVINPTGNDAVDAVYIGNYYSLANTNGQDFTFPNLVNSSISDSGYAIVYSEQTLSSGQSTSQTNQLGVTDPRDWYEDEDEDGEELEDGETGPLYIQSWSDTNQGTWIDRYDCRTESLGVSNLDVTSNTNARIAFELINDALESINTFRATAGSQSNRLEHAANNIVIASLNLSKAKSGIEDADMAGEMMKHAQSNVLSQASIFMLAQANQQPTSVLDLLKTL